MYNEDELFGDSVQEEQETDVETQTQDDDLDHDDHNVFDEESLFDNPDLNTNDGDGNEDDQNDNPDEDFMSKYLRSKKLDKSKIRIFNEETQAEEEVDFDSLSDDEKLEVLNSVETPMLSNEEVDAINFLREHNLDLQSYTEAIRNQVIQELSQEKITEVHNISDDDLFKFDLIERYGFDQEKDAEEIETILAYEKENETLFKRKIDAIRKEYEDLEESQRTNKLNEEKEEEERQWEDMKNSLIQTAYNIDSLHNIELDNNDKNEILSFLLNKDDVSGETDFIKLYKDPESLFKMAWYALKGEEAFRTIEDYFKGKLAEARRETKPAEQNRTLRKNPQTKK